MSNLILIDGHKPGGRRSMEVAARFRAELGRLNISGSEAARRVGKSQPWMSRRTNGTTAFDVDDLDMVCRKLGMSYEFVAAGVLSIPPTPGQGSDQVSERSTVQSRQGAPRKLRLVASR